MLFGTLVHADNHADSVPATDAPTVLITGANRGIGLELARQYSGDGWHVIATARNPDRADDLKALPVEIATLDVADPASVDALAKSLEGRPIDLLINNAGVMVPPFTLTKDGFELQFGANHLGHFALAALLAPQLRAAPNSRIVNVSSLAAQQGVMNFDDLMGMLYCTECLEGCRVAQLQCELAPEKTWLMVAPGRPT